MMKTRTIFSLLFAVILSVSVLRAEEPVRVIFETDMGNDVDDALALDMLYKYQEAGRIRLLFISNNKADTWSEPFIRLMNDFYGHPDIPVSTSPASVLPEQRQKTPAYTERVVRSEKFGPMSDFVVPSRRNSIAAYREILASQPDRSVVIISVGFATNLRLLLESAPDAASDLSGEELVARKVRLLSMMGGNFVNPQAREFNIRYDVLSARTLFERWPTDILLSPWETGASIRFRASALDSIVYAAPHPLKMAYGVYLPMPYDRECWDETSVMAGVENPSEWFSLSPRGCVTVDDAGHTLFTENERGRVRILSIQPNDRERVVSYIEDLVVRTPLSFPANAGEASIVK